MEPAVPMTNIRNHGQQKGHTDDGLYRDEQACNQSACGLL